MSRRTKIIIWSVIVLLLAALAVFLYFLFNRPTPPPPESSGDFPSPTDEVLPDEDPSTVLPEETPGAFEPILRQLSKVPVAGAVLGSKSGEAIVRYQERGAGNVYEIGANGEGEKRLTNTTIPKVQEAIWSKSGTAVISRYLRENSEIIESFSGRVSQTASGTEGELQGTFLQRGIQDVAISPDGTSLFYLLNENSGASGIRSDLAGNTRTKIWSSPVSEWLAFWPTQNKLYLLSKPSGLASGMLLSLNPQGTESSLVLRDVPGLTALVNPARPEVLYSSSNESGISLVLRSIATGAETTVNTPTLPEKCVWNKGGDRFYCGIPKAIPTGTYPDVWYQGVISFEDEVWSINASGGSERILDVSSESGASMDIVRPQLSADEKFFVFTDKESGFLWSLQMKE